MGYITLMKVMSETPKRQTLSSNRTHSSSTHAPMIQQTMNTEREINPRIPACLGLRYGTDSMIFLPASDIPFTVISTYDGVIY
jgi:hypothetical protein